MMHHNTRRALMALAHEHRLDVSIDDTSVSASGPDWCAEIHKIDRRDWAGRWIIATYDLDDWVSSDLSYPPSAGCTKVRRDRDLWDLPLHGVCVYRNPVAALRRVIALTAECGP